jgi:hypothetical protein
MSDEIAVEQILAVLAEGIEGPQQSWSYFLDQGPDAGLRRTLAAVSAEDASKEIGGSTIAAHVHHLVFSAHAFGTFIAGDRRRHDWNESWRVTTVDAAAWDALREELRTSSDGLRKIVQDHAKSDSLSMGGSIGVVAHLAYHVGAIRQKLATLKAAQ